MFGYRTGIKMRYLKGDVKWLWENIESRGRRPDCVPPGKAISIFAGDFLHRQRYDYLDRSDLRPAFAALAGNVGLAQQRFTKSPSANPSGRPDPDRTQRRTALSSIEVAVIGAGPYGLSVGAHLKHAGIEHRVFGHTMGAWRSNMPAGMILKSEPYASDLSAPSKGFLARDYCDQAKEVYHERVIPLSREQFIAYGSWFAGQLVPDVEETEIASLSQAPTGGFLLRTANGEHIRAARVVVATGIIPFAFLPQELSALPSDLVSHTSEHASLARFRGKDILVVGGGSSALETAALLVEQGANVKLVMRKRACGGRRPTQRIRPACNGSGNRSFGCAKGGHAGVMTGYLTSSDSYPRKVGSLEAWASWVHRVPGGCASESKERCRCSSATRSMELRPSATASGST